MHFMRGEVVEVYEEDGLRMGKVRVGGAFTRVVLTLLPEVEVGDVVLAHAGVAISKVQVGQEEDSQSGAGVSREGPSAGGKG